MPRADATELAPKKSAHRSPPATPNLGAGGLSAFLPDQNKNLHFFGETPERRPWAKNARPAAFAGRTNLRFPRSGILPVPTRASILSRHFNTMHLGSGAIRQISPGTTVRKSKENSVTRYTDVQRIGGLQRMPSLHTASTARAHPHLHIKPPHQGHAHYVFLILSLGVPQNHIALAMWAGGRQRHSDLLIHPQRCPTRGLLTVLIPRFASRCFGICFGIVAGERSCVALPFAHCLF